ncbi:hypothetical protein MU694_12175 [Pseudomonas aeruginosa]|nr:hypothetical protein [Pseudomonas aeruginosa]MDJ1512260.1 hypothetical protein [Pseudomonas aeruginosa]
MNTFSPVRRERPGDDPVSGNDQDQRLFVLQLPDDARVHYRRSIRRHGHSPDALLQRRERQRRGRLAGQADAIGVLAIDLRQGAGREVGVPN